MTLQIFFLPLAIVRDQQLHNLMPAPTVTVEPLRLLRFCAIDAVAKVALQVTALANMPVTRPAHAARSVTQKSRVSNGKALFLEGDQRTAAARRFRDVLTEIVGDLGGHETLSEAQRQLARRAATLSVQCEALEAQASKSGLLDAESLETYGQLTDRLGRCFARLGLNRVPRDVTPDLSAYVAGKAAAA